MALTGTQYIVDELCQLNANFNRWWQESPDRHPDELWNYNNKDYGHVAQLVTTFDSCHELVPAVLEALGNDEQVIQQLIDPENILNIALRRNSGLIPTILQAAEQSGALTTLLSQTIAEGEALPLTNALCYGDHDDYQRIVAAVSQQDTIIQAQIFCTGLGTASNPLLSALAKQPQQVVPMLELIMELDSASQCKILRQYDGQHRSVLALIKDSQPDAFQSILQSINQFTPQQFRSVEKPLEAIFTQPKDFEKLPTRIRLMHYINKLESETDSKFSQLFRLTGSPKSQKGAAAGCLLAVMDGTEPSASLLPFAKELLNGRLGDIFQAAKNDGLIAYPQLDSVMLEKFYGKTCDDLFDPKPTVDNDEVAAPSVSPRGKAGG